MGHTCGEPNEIELTIRVLTGYVTAYYQAASFRDLTPRHVWRSSSTVSGLVWSYVLGINLDEPFLLEARDLAAGAGAEFVVGEYFHGLGEGAANVQ